MVRKGYTAVSLTPEAAEALRRMAIFMSAATGERCTLSETVLLAERVLIDSPAMQAAYERNAPSPQ